MDMAKEYKWVLKEEADPEKVHTLSAEVGIEKVLATLLVRRGVFSVPAWIIFTTLS